jgi:hypothetical protein
MSRPDGPLSSGMSIMNGFAQSMLSFLDQLTLFFIMPFKNAYIYHTMLFKIGNKQHDLGISSSAASWVRTTQPLFPPPPVIITERNIDIF